MSENRIVIAGAGPVGLTLALALKLKGIEVVVAEAGPTYCQEFRAPAFHAPTLDLLDTIGMLEPMKQIGLIVATMKFTDRTLGRSAELDMKILQDRGLTDNPYDLLIGQIAFCGIGYEKCREAGVEFRFEHTVTGVGQDDDGAWVDCETPGGTARLRGRYVVGADGGRSIVRKSLPVEFEGFTWPERFLMIHVKEDLEPALGKVNFLADGPDWRLIMRIPYGPGPDDWISRLVSSIPIDLDEKDVADPAFLQSRFDGLIPGRDGTYPIRNHYTYSVNQRVASSFRVGRVLLAGDAAHINNPLGGLGLNCGIHDAFNLAGQMKKIWDGAQEGPLLDLYDRQRRLTNAEYIQPMSVENKQRQEATDLAAREAGLNALQAMEANDDMRLGFLKRWTMIDSLGFEQSIA